MDSGIKLNSILDVIITYIADPGKFFVREQHMVTKYENLAADLREEYNVDDLEASELIAIGMHCVVHVNESIAGWYRGVVEGSAGRGRFDIFLVDVGDRVVVHWTRVKPIKEWHSFIEPLVQECFLANLRPRAGKWSEGSVALLQQFQSQVLRMHVIYDIDGVAGVKLYRRTREGNDICINDEMITKEFGLFRPTTSSPIFSFCAENKKENIEQVVDSGDKQGPVASSSPLPGVSAEACSPTDIENSFYEEFQFELDRSIIFTRSNLQDQNILNNTGDSPIPGQAKRENKLITVPIETPDSRHFRIRKSVIFRKSITVPIRTITRPIPLIEGNAPIDAEARVLHYHSPSLLYISLERQKTAFTSLLDQMHDYYSAIRTEGKRDWSVGDHCCTRGIRSPKWHRAVILEVLDQTAKVFCSDFAYVEIVPVDSLRELHSDFMVLGDAAIKCHLSGIAHPGHGEEWAAASIDYLKEQLNTHTIIYVTKTGNLVNNSMPIKIRIYHIIHGGALDPDFSEWQCLNMKIVEEGLALPAIAPRYPNFEHPIAPSLPFDRPARTDYENLPPLGNSLYSSDILPMPIFDDIGPIERPAGNYTWSELVGQEEENSTVEEFPKYPSNKLNEFMCEILIINSLEVLDLYIIFDEETNELYEKMFEELHSKAATMPPLKRVLEHRACVARYPYNGQWSRASIIVKIPAKDRVLVRFVDNGCKELLPLTDVREISGEFTSLPPKTISATLSGIIVNPSVKKSVVEERYIDTFFDKNPFRATVISYDKSIPSVELRTENNELVYAKLIEIGFLIPYCSRPKRRSRETDKIETTRFHMKSYRILARTDFAYVLGKSR